MATQADIDAKLQEYLQLKQSGMGAIELTRQSIYDTYDIQKDGGSAVATQTIKFFKIPTGQSSKTDLDTNLDTAGQIPYTEALVIGFRSSLVTRSATLLVPGDYNQVYNCSVFEVYKEDRLILREPLAKIPAGYGPVAGVGGSLSYAVIANGFPAKGNMFDIYPELFMKSDRIQIDVRILQALASVSASDLYLRIEAECEIKREYR